MTPAKVNTQQTNQEKIEALKEKMDSIYKEFLSEINDFIRTWSVETSQRIIQKFPEIQSDYSQEELQNIINECEDLSTDIAVKFKNEIASPEHWWHLGADITDRNYYKTIDNLVGESTRFILGEIGTRLNNYGFLPKMVKPFHGFLSERDGSNFYRFEYVDPIYWSRDMKRTFDNYWELFKYAMNLSRIN